MKAKRIKRSLISMIMSMVLIIGMVPASAITALASEDEAEEVLLEEVEGDAAEVLTDDTQDTDVSVTSEEAASAPGEYPPDFEADEEGNIKTVSVFHPYMKVGESFETIYISKIGTPENVSLSPGYGKYDLYEKETGCIVATDGSYTGKLDYKVYILKIYMYANYKNSQTKYRFSDDTTIYLKHHSNEVDSDRWAYLPATHVYPANDAGSVFCAEFELDYTYYDTFTFAKKVIGLHGTPYTAAYPVAWHNKDDVLGDGKVSFDPIADTLHIKGSLSGDFGTFWLSRWPKAEPPRISIDAEDVNVDHIIFGGSDSDSIIICGNGTLNLGRISNGNGKKLIFSCCNTSIGNWDSRSKVELECTNLINPDGAKVFGGFIKDKNGQLIAGEGSDVRIQRALVTADSGDVGTIHWNYDFASRTFSVSGSGRFERLMPYDKYLDICEYFRTEAGVTELGDNIIRDSKSLRKVFLVNTIKKIGRNNFAGCKYLAEADLPTGLEYINSGCFSGSGIKNVSIPKSLLRIDDECYSDMPELETIYFPFEEKQSYLVVGDGCFAHLPAAKEIVFGDGPWIIGNGSFCDMPQLTWIRNAQTANQWDMLDVSDKYPIMLSDSLYYVGDYSFSDLPKANDRQGLNIPQLYGIVSDISVCYQSFRLHALRLRDIGRGSLGYANGESTSVAIDGMASDGFYVNAIPASRYAWGNMHATQMRLAKNDLPSTEYTMGIVTGLDEVVDENDIQALRDYLNLPVKVIGPGGSYVGSGDRTRASDIDFSAKVDHKDLILLKRRVAGWDGLDKYFDRDGLFDKETVHVDKWRAACENNFTKVTGLKLEVGSLDADYAEDAIVKVPVSSVYNTGYIGGSVTAKWNPEAMELVGVEYNDALAPENGTGTIDNELKYTLEEAGDGHEALELPYAGEHVIRFGDDMRTENYTGTGELFKLVFKLKEGAKPDAYHPTKVLENEVTIKAFDIYNADLNFVRTEMTEAGTVRTRVNDPVIRDISVTGIAYPFAGQKPSLTAIVPDGAPYRTWENGSLGTVVWLGESTPENYNVRVRPEYNETFEEGKKYKVAINLEPTTGSFSFADSAELKGTINGNLNGDTWVNTAVEGTHDPGTWAELSYVFTCVSGIAATGLVLDQENVTLTAGESTALQIVTFTPANATDLGVVWTSSDSGVAMVDANGRVSALKAGTAVITATSLNGGVSAACNVTVQKRNNTLKTVSLYGITAPVDGKKPSHSAKIPSGAHYRLSESTLFGGKSVVWLKKFGDNLTQVSDSESFKAGEEYYVWVYVEPENSETDTYLFTNMDEMQAALNGRNAEVQWLNDEKTQACIQYVFTARLTDEPEQAHVHTLIKHEYKAPTVSDPGNIEYWECIECGKLFSDEAGTVEINPEDTLIPPLTVTTDPVVELTGISVSANFTIKTDEITKIDVKYTPENATEKSVSYVSSNEKVLTVDENGNLKGLKPGYSTISVTSKEGGYTAECKVTVSPERAGDNALRTWISPEDLKDYKIPEMKYAKVISENVKIGPKGETKEVTVTVSMNYLSAVTYNGKAITPKTCDELEYVMDLSGLLTAAGISGKDAKDFFKVTYAGKSKNVGDGSFYAKVALVSKLRKNTGISKQQEKDLKKIVKAVNKALKKDPVKFYINKASIVSAEPVEVHAKLKKDGSLNIKNDKLKGIKSVNAKLDPKSDKLKKLGAKMYTLTVSDAAALKVKVKGAKNYTGWTTVTATK